MREAIVAVRYQPPKSYGQGSLDVVNAMLVVTVTTEPKSRHVLRLALQAMLPGVHVSDQPVEGDATRRELYVSMSGSDVPADWGQWDADSLYKQLVQFQYCEYVQSGVPCQILLFMTFVPSAEFKDYLRSLFPGMRTPAQAGHPYGPEVLSVIVPDPSHRARLLNWPSSGPFDNEVNQALTKPWLS